MIPFYSPNPRGRLYKRYTFDGKIKAGDSEQEVRAQLSNFANYKTIKWVLERRLESGRYAPATNVAVEKTNIYIRSNTLEEISQGDVIWLKSTLFPKGDFFIVAGDVEQEFTSLPKERKTFVHIPLTLVYDNPNY